MANYDNMKLFAIYFIVKSFFVQQKT